MFDENKNAVTDAPRCDATTARGTPCRAYARPSSTVCYEHDPTLAEARRAGKVRGARAAQHAKQEGAQMQKELSQAVESASTPREVAAVMVQVASRVLAGVLPPRTGAVFAQLGNVALSGMKADLNERLERLQKVIDSHPELQRAWKRR